MLRTLLVVCLSMVVPAVAGQARAQTCPNPRSIGCDDSDFDDNANEPKNIDGYSCLSGQAEGPEVYYLLTLDTCTEVSVTLDPEDGSWAWDAVLALLPESGGDCDPQACIDGEDDGWEGDMESVSAVLGPGNYYIVVDGYFGASWGDYDLWVSCDAYPCPDADGDGHMADSCPCGDDCDDGNPAVHPGAADNNCDFTDNDCDGVTDEDANTEDDPQNCGACGNVCGFPHAAASCQAGTCVMGACDAGFADCNSSDADGCEVQLGTDQNCSGCGDACAYDHAAGSCQSGSCVMGACDTGFADCNGLDSDGCETGLGTNANCSGCGDVCTDPAFCWEGACITECPGDLEACGGTCLDVSADVNNCGGCGVVCSADHGTPGCTNGTCVVAACDDGFADCNQDYADGCETELGTDQNCSACGDTCGFDHASAGCINGHCALIQCDSGYGNCNHQDADGCETQLGTNQNCSACGDTCEPYEECTGGQCVSDCSDADGDGHQDHACGGDDCDDSDATAYPGANEICGDGIDQDCDGQDLACGCDDLDGDGHEDESCGGDDCNDTDGSIHPGAAEICGDGVDQDCNGEDLSCGCDDADGDGHEDESCGGDDCDDTDGTIHPGATEICGDGIDQDCSGEDLACSCDDLDSDGHQDESCGGDDCDDTNSLIHPGAEDACGDGVDQDCDGVDPPCDCPDRDGDGHQDAACGGDDCNDDSPWIHPGALDDCGDGIDQNCDGQDRSCGDKGGCGCGPQGVPAASIWMFVLLAWRVGKRPRTPRRN